MANTIKVILADQSSHTYPFNISRNWSMDRVLESAARSIDLIPNEVFLSWGTSSYKYNSDPGAVVNDYNFTPGQRIGVMKVQNRGLSDGNYNKSN